MNLSFIVKQETGLTLKKWIDCRLDAVIKTLLVDSSNYTLDQIAEKVGIASASQVVRFFKKYNNGQTPNAYRNEIFSKVGLPLLLDDSCTKL